MGIQEIVKDIWETDKLLVSLFVPFLILSMVRDIIVDYRITIAIIINFNALLLLFTIREFQHPSPYTIMLKVYLALFVLGNIIMAYDTYHLWEMSKIPGWDLKY